MTTGCFVAWPLAGDAARVRETVRAELADATGPGVTDLLPDVGATTVSVLLYDPNEDGNGDGNGDGDRDGDGGDPLLVWYVEHESGDAWSTPEGVLREHSPLWPALEPLLGDGNPAVIAEGAPGATELVHAFLPDRPTAWRDPGDGQPALLPKDDEDGADEPDVVPVKLAIRPGLGTLFARAAAWVVDHTPARVEATFEAWTEPILEAEGMYTETLLLARTDRGFDLWWYMEAGDMGQVEAAYHETDSYVARVADVVLGWVLERPGRALGDPVGSTRFELLAHAVAPHRG